MDPGRGLLGPLHLMLDSTVVALALPQHPRRRRRRRDAAAVGDERLPADDRGPRRHRRAARRHVRPQAGLPRRHGASSRSAPSSPAPPGPTTLIGGRVLQGVGAAPMLSLSLAIVCNAFPAERAAARARHLGGGLGDRPGDRAAGRRPPDRARLAADLLDQPADRRPRRSRSSPSPRPSRPTPAPGTPDRLRRPGRAQRRPHRARPGPDPVAGLGRRG